MIEIHTLGWKGDRALTEEDGPTAEQSIYARVFVDGVEIPGVIRVRTNHRNDFTLTTITVCAPVEVFNHTDESWRAL